VSLTRQDVERWWRDCVDGRRTTDEVSRWAEDQLDAASPEEELILQGLLELQGLRFGDRDAETMRARLRRWQAELEVYDRDPDAWDRRYFQQLLVRFRERHGLERTRGFGRRLVRHGVLSDRDVEEALDDPAG
jgi:hypothetical protein